MLKKFTIISLLLFSLLGCEKANPIQADISINGVNIGMDRSEYESLINREFSKSDFVIGGVHQIESSGSKPLVDYYKGTLVKLYFYFSPSDFDQVVKTIKTKYPRLDCKTAKQRSNGIDVECELVGDASTLVIGNYSDAKGLRQSVVLLAANYFFNENGDEKPSTQNNLIKTIIALILLIAFCLGIYIFFRILFVVGKALAKDDTTELDRSRNPKLLHSHNDACPQCGSTDWKLASLICAEGISNISTSTVLIGSDIEGNVLGGLGRTSGSQQTTLSKLAAPPKKETRTAKLFLILSGIIAIFSLALRWEASLNISFAIALASILRMVLTPKIGKRIDENYRKELQDYEKKKMCLRCGTFYWDNK